MVFTWGGVRLSPLPMSATIWHIVPALDDEFAALGRMRTGRGNLSTWRKPAPAPTLSITNSTYPVLG
jgi:hypothetical protein